MIRGAGRKDRSLGTRVEENSDVTNMRSALFSSVKQRPFLRPPQFSRGQKSEKCIERAESLTETLATQANKMVDINDLL